MSEPVFLYQNFNFHFRCWWCEGTGMVSQLAIDLKTGEPTVLKKQMCSCVKLFVDPIRVTQ